jgi:uncharacterized protein (DUF736 family)
MAVIGIFSAVNDGYAGTIRTLNINARVKIVANERKETEGAPDIGAVWRRIKQGTDQSYLRVRLDDPGWSQPIWANLTEAAEDGTARLIWRRDRSEGT